MHIQLTCDQLVSTCVGWPNGERLASTCIEFEFDQSQHKWVAKRKALVELALTCARRLASPFGHWASVTSEGVLHCLYYSRN